MHYPAQEYRHTRNKLGQAQPGKVDAHGHMVSLHLNIVLAVFKFADSVQMSL